MSLYNQLSNISPLNYVEEIEKKISEILKLLSSVSIIVLTLGSDGAMACVRTLKENNFEFIKVPSIQVNVIDTTGAGDTFLGYFIATLSKENTYDGWKDIPSIRKALQRASVAGGLACERLGAMTSIPSEKEVDQRLIQYQSSNM